MSSSTATSSRTVNQLIKPLQDFLRLGSAGGVILMVAAVLAMLEANSPWAAHYQSFLNLPLEVRIGTFQIQKPLLLWINDGLMAIFFLLVGLELKREILEGHLSSVRQATLPAFAAVGGMLVPAAVYAVLNWGNREAMEGWAIPTATDIAFALGVLMLLGDRVPTALKALLLSVAIFDDLGAIVIIALFYTSKLSWVSLSVAGLLIGGLTCLNRLNVQRAAPYFVLGIPLWVAVLKSGVHATLAGVVLAMFIPLRGGPIASDHSNSDSERSMLRELEHALHPWVAFGVLPLFAFANAGVPILNLSLADVTQSVPLGILLGLVVGKPLGVFVCSWLAIRLGLASLPYGVGWGELFGTSVLCGIGFTMSLFIGSLAFEDVSAPFLGLERLGILLGTLAAGIAGYAILRIALRKKSVELA